MQELTAVCQLAAAHDVLRVRQKSVELGHTSIIGGDERRVGMGVAIGRNRNLALQELDSVAGQGVGAQELVAVGADPQVLRLQHVEEVEQPFGRHLQRLEVGDRGLVRGLLLDPAELEEVLLADGGTAGHDRGAQLRRTRHRRRGTQQRPGDGADTGVLLRFQGAAEVPAGDVAGLVGDHPGELVGTVGLQDQAGVDEQVLPARHERVQHRVVDDVDVDRFRIEPGGGEDRVGDAADRGLDLGIADQAHGVRRRRPDEQARRGHRAPATPPAPQGSPHLSSPPAAEASQRFRRRPRRCA